MILESAKIHASKFRWENSVGTAMASELGYRAGQAPIHQIYDDTYDQGLFVVGKRRNKVFIYKRPSASPDGEIYGWLFESVLADYTIVIFND